MSPDREFAELGREVLALVGQARRSLDDGSTPRDELVGAGLGFLVTLLEPLERCRDQVSGDVATLHTRADEWATIADQLDDSVGQLGSIATGSDWTGAAAASFTDRTRGFGGSVGGAVDACRHLAALLRTSGDLMAGARGLIDDLIDRVVQHMIAIEAAAEAASVNSGGASEAVALSSILGAVSEQVEQAMAVVERVDGLLGRIGDALRSTAVAFGEVDAALARVTELGRGPRRQDGLSA